MGRARDTTMTAAFVCHRMKTEMGVVFASLSLAKRPYQGHRERAESDCAQGEVLRHRYPPDKNGTDLDGNTTRACGKERVREHMR
jgi:hypothetical protein